jgi:superfamily II DNA or RNA helicase
MGRRSVLFVAPCAFGKTVLFSFIAQNALKRGKSTLIIAHRAELIDQISATLLRFQVPHGFIAADRGKQHFPVMVASIQTLAKRAQYMRFSPDMVIVDECHHCTKLNTFGKTLELFPGAKILGVTATPCRLSGEGLGDIFETMILGPDTQHLIDAGRLSHFKLFAPPTVDVSGLHVRAGDYDKAETLALMDKPTITGDAVSHYQKHAAGKPFVAFCAGITHAQNVAEQFRQNGIEAVCIHGMMDNDTRRSIVNDFKQGRIRGLCSVDLISEGFDVPDIQCGLMLRPTASRALHIQQIGRCLRLSQGKAFATILDHVGNCSRHGLPTEPQHWSLEGKVKNPRSKKQEVKLRICPKCWAAQGPQVTVCSECGHEWVVEGRHVEQVSGELVEWVAAKQPKPARVEEWQAKTLEQLIALARSRGYKSPEFWARKRYDYRLARQLAQSQRRDHGLQSHTGRELPGQQSLEEF